MRIRESIPRDKYNLWVEIFKVNNGRFLKNPDYGINGVYVSYTFDNDDDYIKMYESYMRLTTKIVETRAGFWKRIKMKLAGINKGE